ncbi:MULTISPECIES: hypothetical protein [unclassified Pseudonocardia]|uniref:hypothetical protein n=1 Tax=unclassified Pseudonocardia TaxID=2619320 RepID=UPI000AD349D5|nr:MULTISPECIES: hypothetical protein [unclassified Pseudonocardia]
MTHDRSYDVVALGVPIVYNDHGDHDRNGTIYALARDEPQLRAIEHDWPQPFPDPIDSPDELPHPHPLVRPLVLRARVGERVVIHFRNELPRRAGIHPQGVGYDVERADGGVVGFNPDSAADPHGGHRRYVWDCRNEGVFHFGDLADLRGGEHSSQLHGLFGALVVEPAGATWSDPVTGAPTDGVDADVHLPGQPSFREYVVFLHDQTPNDNPLDAPQRSARCDRPVPHTHVPAIGGDLLTAGSPCDHHHDDHDSHRDGPAGPRRARRQAPDPTVSTMSTSYRAEPARGRSLAYRRLLEAGALHPGYDAVADEEQHHSSWLFGDPATPLLRAYRGDRTRIRLVHGGVREAHTFHLHFHQWHTSPGDDRSPVVDSITIGPQQGITIEPIGGAGSTQHATGDALWRYAPHDRSGAWGIWRVFDVMQDGTGRYPDSTPIPALRPLPGHEPPPAPTAQRPGFPTFVSGIYPQRSPRPPRTPAMPPGMGREPTALERDAFCPNPQPGEAFTKVTSDPQAPVRRYDLVALQADISYFRGARSEWHDPHGMLFVLQNEIDEAGGVAAFRAQLESGERDVAPIAIRAAKGEIVELTLTNALPPGRHADTALDAVLGFQPECGLHPHLVKFDPLVGDGTAVGWNYLSAATTADAGAEDHQRYRTWIYRWYCDDELGPVVFHDGALPDRRRRHGLFGCLVVEPTGARWSEPDTPGREVGNASQALIELPDGTEFREQVLGVADSVPLLEHRPGPAGDPINPPPPAPAPAPEESGAHGAMAVDYRCEPLHERPGDPADWFSSSVHGDPATPILRAYPGEPIRVRLYQGSHTQHHSFVTHGLRWRARPDSRHAPTVHNQQTLGPDQAFTLHLDPTVGPGDHLWSLAAADDTWLGCWGLVRFHETHLRELPALPTAFPRVAPPPFDAKAARRYHVRVRAREVRYSQDRTDPLGLEYLVDRTDKADRPGEAPPGPLVLRARAGEWVQVTLANELPGPPPASPFDPPLQGEDRPGAREVSGRVSLQAAALRYDPRDSDGAHVGINPDTTAKPGHSVTYRWYAEHPGAVLLTDRADMRTHRHRGLAGALVVEPPDATPHDPAGPAGGQCWTGEQAVLCRPGHPPEHELVLLLTDGHRLFHDSDPTRPVADLGTAAAGQMAINRRSAHLAPDRPSLADPHPPTPVLSCAPGELIRLHLVMGVGRSRTHTFTVHGHDWPEGDLLAGPRTAMLGALSSGSTRTLLLTADKPGDYAYRAGALRWALTEGLWGLIRIR